MNWIKEETAYQFKDLCAFMEEIEGIGLELFPYSESFDTIANVKTALKNYLSNMGQSNKICDEKYYPEMFCELVNHYFEEYVGVSEDLSALSSQKFFYKFNNVFMRTKDYYTTILDSYEAKKTHLLDQVNSSSDNKVKFNDTPQNTSGTFTGDSYVSTYTHSESENNTDFATPMTRLREIQDSYKNTWNDWIEEFEKIFIKDNWEVL